MQMEEIISALPQTAVTLTIPKSICQGMDRNAENTWPEKPGVRERGKLSAGHARLSGQQSVPPDAACDAH